MGSVGGGGFWEVQVSEPRTFGADCWLTDVLSASGFFEQAYVSLLRFHLNPLSHELNLRLAIQNMVI